MNYLMNHINQLFHQLLPHLYHIISIVIKKLYYKLCNRYSIFFELYANEYLQMLLQQYLDQRGIKHKLSEIRTLSCYSL